ncbi:hypothetical protein T11_14307 [Trichinella zimbabwensis]|uniref:Uncharacterized protein n=1 Tax=Trichinella zimbabwensis TaxID=268475 RepID=A0A0V1H0Z9_9BILA|nr:hypothetical protein T11_14307 [Trichinella zimbabwensis]
MVTDLNSQAQTKVFLTISIIRKKWNLRTEFTTDSKSCMSTWFENLPTNAFMPIPKAWNDVHNKKYFVAENLFNLASLFHGRTFSAERPQVAHL